MSNIGRKLCHPELLDEYDKLTDEFLEVTNNMCKAMEKHDHEQANLYRERQGEIISRQGDIISQSITKKR